MYSLTKSIKRTRKEIITNSIAILNRVDLLENIQLDLTKAIIYLYNISIY